MTNKIVQLEDKAGNNLFPIAGGMAADSITTTMLQDGAVTPDKASFTTLSTSEKVVGNDSNGNTIYEKVFSGTYNAVDGRVSIALTNGGWNDYRIIYTGGYIELTAGAADSKYPTPLGQSYWSSSKTLSAASYITVNTTGALILQAIGSATASSCKYYVIIKYTKTTN